ncbi:hypothetical protein Tco_0134611 [Tanacetum coccineum]
MCRSGIGPEQDRVVKDLTPKENEMYKPEIRATNILLQGLPKDIYTLINHYTDTKDIWDNVKMLLEVSELTRDERESQLYDDIEHFRQNKGETIHEYYLNSKFMNNMLLEWGTFMTAVNINRGLKTSNYDQLYAYLKQHEAHANENKMMLEKYTQHAIDPLAFVSNVSPQQYPSQSSAIPQSAYVSPVTYQPQFANNTQPDLGLTPTDDLIKNITKIFKTKGLWFRMFRVDRTEFVETMAYSKTMHSPKATIEFRILQGQDAANASSREWSNLALNVDHVFQADQCDAFDSDVDEDPTAQTMFMANLSSADLIYDDAGPSYDSDILSENHVVYFDAEYTSDSNIIPYEQYVKDNAVQVVQSNVSSMPNDALMMIINDMHEQISEIVEQARIVEFEAEISKLKHKIKKDDHSEMIKHFSNLEVDPLNLHLKYQNLKERFGNNKSHTAQDAPEFDSFFKINKMKEQLQGKKNTIRQLKGQISHMNERRSEADQQNKRFRAENEKVKQHYKELYDSIKIMRAKPIEKTSSLLTEKEKLKAQLKGKMKCVTMNTVKPKVLSPGMYAIDVEPIPPRNRNNKEVHLDYLKHLKESVETLREIVEEARIEKPLDNALENACFYTKRSQELNKQVTFRETCGTSNNNTQTHVEQLKEQKTNVHVIPSTGVNSSTEASGSKPKSNTKNNRILPAKSDKQKKVEDHPRNNKYNVKQKNRVDFSISSKRTVMNSNSKSVCKTFEFTSIYVDPVNERMDPDTPYRILKPVKKS